MGKKRKLIVHCCVMYTPFGLWGGAEAGDSHCPAVSVIKQSYHQCLLRWYHVSYLSNSQDIFQFFKIYVQPPQTHTHTKYMYSNWHWEPHFALCYSPFLAFLTPHYPSHCFNFSFTAPFSTSWLQIIDGTQGSINNSLSSSFWLFLWINFLEWWKCSIPLLSNIVAISYFLPLSN